MALAAAGLPWLEAHRERFLSPQEDALLTGRLHPRRRHSLLVGRFAAKSALATLLPGMDPRAVAILPGVLGQPVLSGAGVPNIQVSLSHSGSVALAVAFPEACPMGVDLEELSDSASAVMASQMTASAVMASQMIWAERELAASAFREPESGRLTRLWCLKEALSKTLRCGLTTPFQLLAVSHVSAGPARWAEFANFGQHRGLSLSAGGLAAALVLPRNVRLTDDAIWAAAWTDWLAAAGVAAAAIPDGG